MVEALVEFHSDLYAADALERAAAAYAPFATVSLERRGAYSRATVRSEASVAPEVLAREFANFALAACAVDAPGA